MAVRTTALAVGKIIEVDASIDLDPFIEVASALVDEVCAASGSTYTPTRLEQIERWLSAHFYAIRDARVSSEGAGPVSASYQKGTLGMNLQFTQWGQMALTLDTAGGLAALSKANEEGTSKVTPRVVWLGKPRSQQTPPDY